LYLNRRLIFAKNIVSISSYKSCKRRLFNHMNAWYGEGAAKAYVNKQLFTYCMGSLKQRQQKKVINKF
jgi:hypothetical protein